MGWKIAKLLITVAIFSLPVMFRSSAQQSPGWPGTAEAQVTGPQFLTFPIMRWPYFVGDGWVYEAGRCVGARDDHNGIDYGTIYGGIGYRRDGKGTWTMPNCPYLPEGSPIFAAADGWAMASCQPWDKRDETRSKPKTCSSNNEYKTIPPKYRQPNGAAAYGNFVLVNHGNGYSTLYAHLNDFAAIFYGDPDTADDDRVCYPPNKRHWCEKDKWVQVKQGQLIGYAGIGGTFYHHLHFEAATGAPKDLPNNLPTTYSTRNRTDPYAWKTTHQSYPDYDSTDKECGEKSLWQECPPRFPAFPVPIELYRGEYYGNRDLSGVPTFVREERGAIDYDWGDGGPSGPATVRDGDKLSVGSDNFSVRWTGRFNFEPGTYTFLARADDGIRVWVDNNLIVDAWRDQPPSEYRANLALDAGHHEVKVEYYEHGGGAVVEVRSELAAILAPSNLDVALIIDSSGSMSWNDPSELRKTGARAFINTALDDDYVAVIDFDWDATVPGPLARVGDARAGLLAAVDTIDSSGGTNIGIGVQAACDQLSSSPSGNNKAAILLTNGHGWFSNEHQCFIDNGWPIYTLGLGDADVALLQRIADETSGEFQGLVDPDQLPGLYLKLRAELAGVPPLADLLELVEPFAEKLLPLVVPPALAKLAVAIIWGGSDIDVTLITPSGREISCPTADPDVVCDQGATFEVITVDMPEAGQWTIRLFGADVPPEGEQASVIATGIPLAVLPIVIDIKPGSDPNAINLDSIGVIPVAVLTTSEAAGEPADFDATTVDPSTVGFGPGDAPASHSAAEDVDLDGDMDLIMHFDTAATGLSELDVEACLTGETFDGQAVEGCDSVAIVPPGS